MTDINPVAIHADPDEISLADLLVPLIRGWRLIAAITALAIGVATGASLWRSPMYEASAILVAVEPQGLGEQVLPNSLQIPAPGLPALAELTKSEALLAAVAQRLGKPDAEDLRNQVEARADTGRNLLVITATGPSPAEAAAVANAVADALAEHVARVHLARLIAQLEAAMAQLDAEIAALEDETRRMPVTLEGVDLRLGPDVELSTVNPIWRELSVRAAAARAQRRALEAWRQELQATALENPAARAELAGIVAVASAYQPTRPVGAHLALNAAVAGMLGLMVGVFAVFARQAWVQYIAPVLGVGRPSR